MFDRVGEVRLEIVGVDEHADRIHLRHHRFGQRAEVGCRVGARRDDRHRPSGPGDRDQFALPMGGQGEHRNRAEPEQREHRLHVPDAIGDLHHDPVLGSDTGCHQSSGQTAHPVVEVAVGESALGVDDRKTLLAARLLRPGPQHVVEGVAGPESQVAVAFDKVRGPGSNLHIK